MARRAAWAALLLQPVFTAYWALAGALEPGYSPTRQHISELGAPRASAPWLLDAMLVVWGASMLLAALALRRALPRARVTMALLVVAGVAIALAGPFHLACWTSLDPRCPGHDAFSARAHNALAFVNQIALLLSAPALAWALRGTRVGKLLVPLALIAVVTALGLWAGRPRGDRDRRGAEQRVSIVLAQLWIAGIAGGTLVRRT